jgi:uncharacterized protein YegP (UPF0339 family)
MAAKFELKSSKNGQFMFNLKAANGEIILTSETYKEKTGALNGIQSVKANAAENSRFDRKTAEDGQAYFVLKAANQEVIGKSEMYKSTAAMENGIASVKKNAPEARVEDLAS